MLRYGWICAIAALAGCASDGHLDFLGYTTRPPFDGEIRRIYIANFKNYTYHRGIEYQLQRALIEEFGRRPTPIRVTSNRDQADAELLCQVVSRRKQVINFNQQNETRDAELAFNVEVAFLDLRPGRVGMSLLNPTGVTPIERADEFPPEPKPVDPKNPPRVTITPAANYIPELGGSQASAEARIAQVLARQIVNMMESYR